MERPQTKTNAQRNREYRLRKGEEINEKRRLARMSNRAIITPKIEYEEPEKELKKVAKLPTPKPAEPKGDNTKQSYISFIRQFYKRYTDQELSDTADIIKKINEERYNALNVSKQLKKIITENFDKIRGNRYEVDKLYKILRGVRGFTDILKRLYSYVLEYAEQYEEKRSVAKVEDKEDLDISFEMKDINENINRLSDKTDKIIYGYIFIVKGRLNDLRLIKITNNKADINDKEFNYIYDDVLYINKTKNGKATTHELPKDFTKLYDENEGGYLLGELYPPSTLSQRLQKITKNIYGKVYTYLNIRHLNATQINAKGASLKERQETSKQAGHSVDQQLRYVYKIA